MSSFIRNIVYIYEYIFYINRRLFLFINIFLCNFAPYPFN
nr:MAG TPA: hypothetical protein [Caudoviricetes sp.]